MQTGIWKLYILNKIKPIDENSKSFYYGEDVFSAFEKIYADFERVKLNPDGKRRIIICDEYVTLIDKLDKKRADRLRLLLGILVFESREYRLYFYFGTDKQVMQRDFLLV